MTINIQITQTPDYSHLHALHAASFERGWKAEEFKSLLAGTGCMAMVADAGFALVRLVAGEAEILTIAVEAQSRRAGVGRALMQSMITWLKGQQAESLFLEVNAANLAAIALYEKLGFALISRRARYYTMKDGSQQDALIFRLTL